MKKIFSIFGITFGIKSGMVEGFCMNKTPKVKRHPIITHLEFQKVKKEQRPLVHQWLKQPHISKWIHGQGLANTLEGLDKSFVGKANASYWIAYIQKEPFSFLITSEVENSDPFFSKYMNEVSKAITLDLFICVSEYLGKGIGPCMIEAFLESKFPKVTDVFIDPEVSNEYAVRAYQKSGFEILETFIASWHPVPHYLMRLKPESLLKP